MDIINSIYDENLEDDDLDNVQIKKYPSIIENHIDKNGNDYIIKKKAGYWNETQTYEEAISYYSNLANFGNVDAMFTLALIYEELEDYKNMIRYYETAVEKGSISSINNLAVYYINIKKFKKAEKYLDMALEIDSENYLANRNYDEYIFSVQDHKEEMKNKKLEKAFKLNILL